MSRRWADGEYLCFVVRRDLRWSQRAAQLAHAADEWHREHGYHGGPVLVFGVSDTARLERLFAATADAVGFREPDLGDELTAFATRQIVPGLRLL